ncbi:unnamed protein product, partial [Ectocarpus fasciculatus]
KSSTRNRESQAASTQLNRDRGGEWKHPFVHLIICCYVLDRTAVSNDSTRKLARPSGISRKQRPRNTQELPPCPTGHRPPPSDRRPSWLFTRHPAFVRELGGQHWLL